MQAVAGKFVTGYVIAHLATPHAVGDQLRDQLMQLALGADNLVLRVQEPDQLGVVAAGLLHDAGVAVQHRHQPVGAITRASTYLAELSQVSVDLAGMPAVQDRVDVGEVLIKRRPPDPGPLGDLGHGDRAQTVLNPPASSAQARAAFAILSFTTVGLLPPAVRSGYGIAWTPAHTAAHAAMRLSVRRLRPALPERLRRSPVYDLAMDRAQGHPRGSEIA